MRLPELDFLELWNLLLFSKIENNRIGSILIIEELYGEDLLEILLEMRNNNGISKKEKQALKLIKQYSLPFGVFHWKRNTDLNQDEKIKIIDVWTRINEVITELISR